MFSITTSTRYNAEGNPLVSVQKSLMSNLSDALESKNLTINERNLTSTQWVEYHVGTKRKSYNTLPTSNITAEAVTVDGFTLTQTDNSGVTATHSRSYSATGMIHTRTDGCGNTTTTVTDKAGRTLTVTDATGNGTTTAYDSAHDLPATVTDAQGNTSCYRYDARGRKLVEWGTGIQPVMFGYDDADRMTSLTTFRCPDAVITTDPSERTDKDVTTWSYHNASGMETAKTYADSSSVSNAYDAYNRVLTETDARGKVKTHTHEPARGLLLGTTYSDSSTPRAYTYTPYGEVTESANGVYQPIQWSSEYNDTELGLVYYNYRHYNPTDGRWLGRDIITRHHLYLATFNNPIAITDMLGLYEASNISDYIEKRVSKNTNSYDFAVASTSDRFSVSGPYIEIIKGNYWVKTPSRKLIVTIYIYSEKVDKYDLNAELFPNRTYKSIMEHEKHHVELTVEEWNAFVIKSKDFEGCYCSKDCATLASGIILLYKQLYTYKARLSNTEFDIHEYSLDKNIEDVEIFKKDKQKVEKWLLNQKEKTENKVKEYNSQ